MEKAKIYSPYTRILSLVLSLLIIFYIIPVTVFAENSEQVEVDVENSSIANDNHSYTTEIYEVTELRESNVKHFRLEDGSYIAAQYNYPVHYIDENGELTDINNRLEEVQGGTYANSNSRVRFVKKLTGSGKLFSLSEDDTKIEVSIINANKGICADVVNSSDAIEDTELQKKMNLENLSSTVTYRNAFDGVDIEYVVHSLNIKENIIVREKSDSYKYSFELKFKNLTPQLSDSGEILLIDSDQNTKYIIPAPYVEDAECVAAPKGTAYYSLSGKENKYTLSINVDAEWMNSDERFYPINVDPIIESALGNNSVQDVTISDKAQQTNWLFITTESFKNAVYYQVPDLPNIHNGTIVGAQVNLFYSFSQDRCFPSVKMHEVKTAWSEETLCYGTRDSGEGLISEHIVDYEVGQNPKFKYTFDVTELCKKWYDDPSSNHGVAFTRYITENEDRILTGAHLQLSARFNSSETSSGNAPSLQISYVQVRGLESYWTYSSHSAGVGGTANINLANGSMVTTIPMLSTTDSLLPYTTALVYDSYFANQTVRYGDHANSTVSYLPFGYRLNMHELIFKNTFGESTMYSYIDADGTEHIFGASTTNPAVYYDFDGLQKVLNVGSSNITITDDSKITKVFTKYYTNVWNLSEIRDTNGNKIVFTFDQNNNRYTKISLVPKDSQTIEFIELRYNAAGRLAMIYNAVSKDAVVLRYSYSHSSSLMVPNGDYLRRIDYAHGNASVTDSDWEAFINSHENTSNITIDNTAIYTYNSSGQPIDISDVNTAQMLRLYWQGKKVARIDYFNNNQLGQSLIYNYGLKYTDVTGSGSDDIINTDDDISTRYVFDHLSRVVSMYSYAKDGTEIYGATVGKYETQDNVKNNLKEQTVLGGSYTNYILNGGFEDSSSFTSFANWDINGTVSRTTSALDYGGGYAIRLIPEVNTTSSISQRVSLEEGTYTLTFQYLLYKIDGIDIRVNISSLSGSGFSHSAVVPLNEISSGITESAFSTTFEVTDGGDDLLITISAAAGSDMNPSRDTNIDSVTLSKQSGTPRYTLVEYGTFEESGIDSSGNVIPLSNYWTVTDSVTTEDVGGVFGKVLKIPANSGTQYASQRVDENEGGDQQSSNTGQYLVSGFAKATNAIPGGTFRIRVDVTYYQYNKPDVVKSFYYDFVTDCTDWQFTGGLLDTEYVPEDESDDNSYDFVTSIDIVCEYSNQPNGDAYFDNISIVDVRPSDARKYYYYEDGLLAKRTTFFDAEYYEYDHDKRIITRVANDDGEIIDYTYDSSDRIVEETYINFTTLWGRSTRYPFGANNIEESLEKTVKHKTMYQYNRCGQVIHVIIYPTDEAGNRISGSKALLNSYNYDITDGSRTFGALISEVDSEENRIYYYYDESDGKLVATVNQGAGTGVCYTYDDSDRLVGVSPATYVESGGYSPVTNGESVSYTYNSSNLLSSISTESTTYTFTYDAFGNSTSSNAGDNTLATYEYAENNGKLKKVTYSNGFSVEYSYNNIEKLSEVWYNNSDSERTLAYEYEYDVYGNISKFIDNIAGRTSVYLYDPTGNGVKIQEYDNDDPNYDFYTWNSYDVYDRVAGNGGSINYQCAGSTYSASSSNALRYAVAGYLESMSISAPISSNYTVDFTYDALNRLSSKTASFGGFTHTDSYTYTETASNTSPTQVHTHTSKVNNNAATVTEYTYDARGNITKIVIGSQEIRYVYDDLGQLVREDNEVLNKTCVYIYDNAGNITAKKTYALTAAGSTPDSPTSTGSYTYGDSAWGDKLTAYNGVTITYDEIGNPLDYYNGFSFTWTGRRLTGATRGVNTLSFTYNDEGIRTSKTVNGVTHKYYLNGSNIIAEVTDSYTIVYIYDENGTPLGMQYREPTYAEGVWDVFWYEKNLQGDIVAVYNASGTKLVAYTYDAWGNHTVTYYNGGTATAAIKNPFRYRGYYYDSDIGLYYLNSRYYDANTGRFINADGYISTGQGILGYNMYAYCGNNPVNYVDYSGTSPIGIALLVAIGVGVLILLTSCNNSVAKDIYDTYENGKDALEFGESIIEFEESTQVHNKYIYAYSEAVVEYNESGSIKWDDTLNEAFSGNYSSYKESLTSDASNLSAFYYDDPRINDVNFLADNFSTWATSAKGKIGSKAGSGIIKSGIHLLENVLGFWIGIAR